MVKRSGMAEKVRWTGDPPAFAHVLEGSIVLRQDEAGMDEAEARAVFDLGKDERDHGVEP
jgi:hypothetical protein